MDIDLGKLYSNENVIATCWEVWVVAELGSGIAVGAVDAVHGAPVAAVDPSTGRQAGPPAPGVVLNPGAVAAVDLYTASVM